MTGPLPLRLTSLAPIRSGSFVIKRKMTEKPKFESHLLKHARLELASFSTNPFNNYHTSKQRLHVSLNANRLSVNLSIIIFYLDHSVRQADIFTYESCHMILNDEINAL